MRIEVPNTLYDGIRSIFAPLAFCTEVPSILDGNTKGVVYTNSYEAPTAAVMWDGLIGVFVAGIAHDEAFNQDVGLWLAEHPVATARSLGIPGLALAFTPGSWQTELPRLLSPLEASLDPRFHFSHPGSHVATQDPGAPYRIVRTSPALMARTDIDGIAEVDGWLTPYWHTRNDFFDRGLGYVALADGRQVVSHCVAVFASGDRLEFGTATHPDHRGRGLSTAVAAACVSEALRRGLEPVWHCWQDNAESAAVARKVGFRLVREYEVYRCHVPLTSGGTS